MNFNIKNIGCIQDATIEVHSISVIAGANNTGKSTITNSLYTMVNTFFNLKARMIDSEEYKIDNSLRTFFHLLEALHEVHINANISEGIAAKMVGYIKKSRHMSDDDLLSDLKDIFLNELKDAKVRLRNFNQILSQSYDLVFENDLKNILNITNPNLIKKYAFDIMEHSFYQKEGDKNKDDPLQEMHLSIDDQNIDVTFDNSKEYYDEIDAFNIKNTDDISLTTDVFYIDSPFILDVASHLYMEVKRQIQSTNDKRTKLFRKIIDLNPKEDFQNFFIEDEFKKAYKMLSTVVAGHIVILCDELYYKEDINSKDAIHVLDLGASFKIFLILKTLMEHDFMCANDVLIIDGIDAYLDNDLIDLLAHVLVLMQKDASIKIVINTKNAYMLKALNKYIDKYEVKRVNYYLTTRNTNKVSILNVDNDISKIYKELDTKTLDLD